MSSTRAINSWRGNAAGKHTARRRCRLTNVSQLAWPAMLVEIDVIAMVPQ